MPDFVLPARVAQLIETDDRNAHGGPQIIGEADPLALRAFDEITELFLKIYDAFGDWKMETAADDELDVIAKAHGLSTELKGAALLDAAKEIPSGAELLKRVRALGWASVLVMGCQRYFAWGSTDLFRLRVTPAQGYLRLEAEAVGWMVVFLKSPDVAEKWATLGDGANNLKDKIKQSKRFYNKNQSKVKEAIKPWRLDETYDNMSNVAQHVRRETFLRTLDFRTRLTDQEFDPNDVPSFLIAIWHFHCTQARVVRAICETLFPDRADLVAETAAFVESTRKAFDDYAAKHQRLLVPAIPPTAAH